MAVATECQTDGAVFHTSYRQREKGSTVVVKVDVPFDLPFPDEKHAQILEANLHNALELVLRPYWTARNGISWHRMDKQGALTDDGS